ncbi:MAG: Uncharacterised protein [Owenweeksia sp. TMED14]|nr:MAG: Uncharacterised protein [Owenweeksia sp. TMED14]
MRKEKKFNWYKSYKYQVNVWVGNEGDITSHLCFTLTDLRDQFDIPTTTVNRILHGQKIMKYKHIASIERVKIPAFQLTHVSPLVQ